MAEPGNGSSVTWRELNLALAPLVEGMEFLKKQVGVLVDERNERIGAERLAIFEKKRKRDWRHVWIGISSSVLGASIGSLILIYFGGH